MFFCCEDRDGYQVLWLPADSAVEAREFAEWAGLGVYVSPGRPFTTYSEARVFVDGIPMWAVGR
jgi:hypothetical protein